MTKIPYILEIENLNMLPGVAKEILSSAGNLHVFAFYGEMGAGKTTLIKAICKVLGVESIVNSPTFSIINEYNTPGLEKVFHFDFYRIKNLQEAYDLGYENYFFSKNYCFIEWPEKIEALLDFPHLKIKITVSGEKRIVTLHA